MTFPHGHRFAGRFFSSSSQLGPVCAEISPLPSRGAGGGSHEGCHGVSHLHGSA